MKSTQKIWGILMEGRKESEVRRFKKKKERERALFLMILKLLTVYKMTIMSDNSNQLNLQNMNYTVQSV